MDPALVVGMLGVMVAVATYWLSRRPKQLGYFIETYLGLLTIEYPGIVVLHGDVEVEHPEILVMLFKNYGKVEIRPEDFVRAEEGASPSALTVTFHNRKLIHATTVSNNPRDIGADLDTYEDGFAVPCCSIKATKSGYPHCLIDQRTIVGTH